MGESFSFDDVHEIKIFPPIGIARLGNHETSYFVGPEQPREVQPPEAGYKREGRVRRQAARFRLYAYDASGGLLGELTAPAAEIEWTVTLANRKAAWRRFDYLARDTPLRNPDVLGKSRRLMEITPGQRRLAAPGQTARFDDGVFSAWSNGSSVTGRRRSEKVYLGEMRTEDSGRLLVLAGHGVSGSPFGTQIGEYANNPGWYDDTADGPVEATVTLPAGAGGVRRLPAAGAWVLCAPAKAAPGLRNMVTLYDVLLQVAVDADLCAAPPPSLADAREILRRAYDIRWVQQVSPRHDAFLRDAEAHRAQIFASLRKPPGVDGRAGGNMPLLFGDDGFMNEDSGSAFTPIQYEVMRRWSLGELEETGADGDGTRITPDGLTRAALEACTGAPFGPGIEASWYLRDVFRYTEPFRLDAGDLEPGDCTAQMAVPWQADMYECIESWWPPQRPVQVWKEANVGPLNWLRCLVHSRREMVDAWHELGFVVPDPAGGEAYVERERNAPHAD